MNRFKVFFSSFKVRVALVLILALFFIASLSNYLIYEFSLSAQFKQLKESLKTVARTASLAVDADLFKQVPLNKEGVNSPSYKIIADKLSIIKKENPHISYVYTMTKTDAYGIWQFVVDPQPEIKSRKQVLTSYPGDRYNVSRFQEMVKSYDGASVDDNLTYDEWGVFLSGYAPIRDKENKTVGIIGIDMSAKDIHQAQQAVRMRALLVLFTGILLSLIIGIFISGSITAPIYKIIDGTRHISKGDLSYKVNIKRNDEIGELARSFNDMSANLLQARQKLEDYFYRVVQSLVRSLEAKDHYTRGHSDRVADYSYDIAIQMGLPKEKVELLKKAAQLHDLGKLGIDEAILNKKEPLTNEEWDLLRKHPAIGEEILQPVFLDKEMLSVVRSHHERYDAGGYPDGLDNEHTTIFAQIVTVADAYDAMTSSRSYRPAMSKEDAIKQLKNNSGTQFNPKIVETFVKILERKG